MRDATLLDPAVPGSAVPGIRLMRSGGEKGLFTMAAQQARTASGPGSAVLLSGTVPPLADAYYPREQTGPDLASSLRAGETVVLVHGGQSELAPAVQAARERCNSRWSPPTPRGTPARWRPGWERGPARTVIAGVAQAANIVDASPPEESAEMAVDRFVSWLADLAGRGRRSSTTWPS